MDKSYCAWWGKPLVDVTEHEMGECLEYDWCCTSCPYLMDTEALKQAMGLTEPEDTHGPA